MATVAGRPWFHLVFGGELSRGTMFENFDLFESIGSCLSCAGGGANWKARTPHAVEDARMHHFIVRRHRLTNSQAAGCKAH